MKGLTKREVKADGSDRRIVIFGAYNLLLNNEQVASELTLLCDAPKSETLRSISDANLSRRVAGMTLHVTLLLLSFCLPYDRLDVC